MYLQLLTRYPTASLVSELLQVQNGNFVVRVIIQVGGVTLTTGMAASPSVEKAEDQARLRALAVLGIYPEEQGLQTHLVPPAPDSPLSPPGSEAAINQEPLASQLDHQTTAWAVTTPSQANSLKSSTNINQASESEYTFTELDLGIESNGVGKGIHSSEGSRQSNLSNNNGKTLPTVEAHNGKPSSHRQHQSAAKTKIPGPVDLSDIIAQTSVELKRLGWSDIQGRLHLQQIYGKRSRQQLTDEELLEFLQYLQVQPSPDEPLF